MSDWVSELAKRLVLGRKRDGRCVYDAQAKQELILACGAPGISMAKLARDCGINANQLSTWVRRHERGMTKTASPTGGVARAVEPAFVIPEQVRVIQHQRIKYACPCCDLSLKVTPAPARIIPRGLLSEAAQAWVITGKYQFGMPLYRQAALLRRFGGDLASNTLAAGVVRIGRAVQPIINLLRDHLLDSDLIYGDETTVQVLKEPGRKAQTKRFMWAQMNGSGPPVRLFAYAPGRGGVHAEKLYAGIRHGATLASDGYDVYNGMPRRMA